MLKPRGSVDLRSTSLPVLRLRPYAKLRRIPNSNAIDKFRKVYFPLESKLSRLFEEAADFVDLQRREIGP
jgi:hypothetical protein